MAINNEQSYRDGRPTLGAGDHVGKSRLGTWGAGILETDAVRDALWKVAAGGGPGGYIPSSEKGAPNGVAELDADALVPMDQLPSKIEFRTEENITIELNQITGVDPTLSKPITKQSEVPATPFKNLNAVLNAIPRAIGHRIVIQLKSDQTNVVQQLAYMATLNGFVGPGQSTTSPYGWLGLWIQGERLELYTGKQPSTKVDNWRFTFPASSFVAGELAQKHAIITAGTGAGQEYVVKDNGTDWVEFLTPGYVVPDTSSVFTFWQPRWELNSSSNGIASGNSVLYIENCLCNIQLRDLRFKGCRTPLTEYNSPCWMQVYNCDFDGSMGTGSYECQLNGWGVIGIYWFLNCVFKSCKGGGYFFRFGSGNLQLYNSIIDDCEAVLHWQADVMSGQFYFGSVLITRAKSATAAVYCIEGLIYCSTYAGGVKLSDGTAGALSVDANSIAMPCIDISRPGAKLELRNPIEVKNSLTAGIRFRQGGTVKYIASSAAIKGSGNAVGILVSQVPWLRLETNSQPGGTVEMRVDGVDYTYAQFVAMKKILHPESGTAVVLGDGSVTKDAGRQMRGVATFSSEASKAVSFAAPFSGTDYAIKLTPSVNTSVWYTSKTASGFTIQVGATITGEVSWEATKN